MIDDNTTVINVLSVASQETSARVARLTEQRPLLTELVTPYFTHYMASHYDTTPTTSLSTSRSI